MEESKETRIAVLAVILEDPDSVSSFNAMLHDYGSYIIGRMGMPYAKKKVNIITIIMDAPEDIISTLSGKLGQLPGVNIKTTYSKR